MVQRGLSVSGSSSFLSQRAWATCAAATPPPTTKTRACLGMVSSWGSPFASAQRPMNSRLVAFSERPGTFVARL